MTPHNPDFPSMNDKDLEEDLIFEPEEDLSFLVSSDDYEKIRKYELIKKIIFGDGEK